VNAIEGLTDEDSALLTHELYLDAIMGVDINPALGIECERNGWAYWSPTTSRHEWFRNKLDELPLETLIDLYMALKEAQL
jgi:hypothetical protein